MYADMTIEQMALSLGVSPRTYIRYESNPGQIPNRLMRRLAEATGVPNSMLVTEDRREEAPEGESYCQAHLPNSGSISLSAASWS